VLLLPARERGEEKPLAPLLLPPRSRRCHRRAPCQSGPHLSGRGLQRRRALALQGGRPLLAGLRGRAGLLRRRTGLRARTGVSGPAIRPRRAARPLAGPGGRIIAQRRVVADGVAALGDDLPADGLRGMDPPHDALIARRLLRRDRQRHRGKAGAGAGTRPDRKAGGALVEQAEPGPGAVVDLDAPDLAVGVGIQLDRDVVRSGAAALSGTSTSPVVPRMPSVAVGVAIVMLPVLATALATKATVPLAMLNSAAFLAPPSS
jgi:hypothetical protein